MILLHYTNKHSWAIVVLTPTTIHFINFTLIFNNLADIPTGEGVPNFLFNLAGITSWNYFKDCLVGIANTFKKNEKIFGKVYFPRVIMPMSVVVSNLLKFGIQIGVFIGFYVYFVWFTSKSYNVSPNFDLVFLPVLVLLMASVGTWSRDDHIIDDNQV